MFTIETLTTFLGWCSIISSSILIISTVLLILLKSTVEKIHSKLFDIDEKALPMSYFQYLGNLKIAIIILNIVPYIALKIMF